MAMATFSQSGLSLVLLILAASPSVHAAGNQGLTHIHLYGHEKFAGANATVLPLLPSPVDGSSPFGRMGVLDDELRDGPDRASSALVGRFQGFYAVAGSGFTTSVTLVFSAGEYAGSTLSVAGPLLDFTRTIERAVVGGTGKFRFASGYSLTKVLGNPTPETSVFEIEVFLLMHRGEY